MFNLEWTKQDFNMLVISIRINYKKNVWLSLIEKLFCGFVVIRSINDTGVVYFDQLLGAAHTQKMVETFFSAVFQPFC